MATTIKIAELQERLETAIEVVSSIGPGTWKSSISEDYLQLVWECDASDAAIAGMYGDEPWSSWGGDTILAAAGIPEYNNSGADTYTNRFGDEIVAQWVQWDFDEDED